jgi:hypothetical protein
MSSSFRHDHSFPQVRFFRQPSGFQTAPLPKSFSGFEMKSLKSISVKENQYADKRLVLDNLRIRAVLLVVGLL